MIFVVLRWIFYQKHYLHPIDLNQSLIEKANNDIQRIAKTLNVART